MTKREIIDLLLNKYRYGLFGLALAARRQDAMRVLDIKVKLQYLLHDIAPMLLDTKSKSYQEFRYKALEVLDERRKTHEELKKEFVI